MEKTPKINEFNPDDVTVNVVPFPEMTNTTLGDTSSVVMTITGTPNAAELSKSVQTDFIKKLGRIKTATQWCLGDMYNAYKGSETERDAVFEAASHKVRTVYQYALVCRRFPHDLRRPDVSYSIHREVWCSTLFTEDAATRNALDFIASNQMTVKEVKAWLAKDKPAVTRVSQHATMKALRTVLLDMKGLDVFPIGVSKAVDKLAALVREAVRNEKPVLTDEVNDACVEKMNGKIMAAINFG